MTDIDRQEEDDEYLQSIQNFNAPDDEVAAFDLDDFVRVHGGFEDCEVDESVGERLLGLAEMFPPSVRSACCKFVNCMNRFFKTTFSIGCTMAWYTFASAVILFAPIIFEYERSKQK